MLSINKSIVAGGVTADPKTEYLSGNNTCKTSFQIATNESYKKDGERMTDTQYHNIEFFGKTAEVIEKYVKKGTGLYVEGRLKHETWEDNDGNKRNRTVIVGDTFKFTTGKND